MSWLIPLVFVSSLPLFSDWTRSWGEDDSPVIVYRRFDLAGPTLAQNENAIFIAAPNGQLEKILLKTGESLWRTKLEGLSQAKWAYSEGELFGGDTKGNIYSIDTMTGEVLWQTKAKGVFYSAPLVLKDFVFFTNSLGTLSAYSRKSGAWTWQYQDQYRGPISLWAYQGPVYFNGKVIAGFGSGELNAFDPESGARLWTESFRSPSVGTDLNDLKALESTENYLAASSFSGNLKVWKKQNNSKRLVFEKRLSLIAPPLIQEKENKIYLPEKNASLRVVNLETGFVEWAYTLPDGGLSTTPAIHDESIWIGSSEGHIYVLNKQGEVQTMTPHIQTSIWNPLVIDKEGHAYVLSSKSILRRLRTYY